MKTTLRILRNPPCGGTNDNALKTLMHNLGKSGVDDAPLSIRDILEVGRSAHYAIWALRAVYGYECAKRLLAARLARQVYHLAKDDRAIATILSAEKFARGEISYDELNRSGGHAWAMLVEANYADAVEEAEREIAIARNPQDKTLLVGKTLWEDGHNAKVAAMKAVGATTMYLAHDAAEYVARDVETAAKWMRVRGVTGLEKAKEAIKARDEVSALISRELLHLLDNLEHGRVDGCHKMVDYSQFINRG